MKKILLALFALLLIPVVHAAVDVTYVFDQSNVNATAYNCLDATCSQVGPFGGSFVDGPYVTDGTLTIRYPDSLNTHGYGVFFVSKGFRPLEIRSTWNTNGVSGLGSPQTVNYYFTKMPNTCRATVSELNFVNEVKPHVPMVINTNARLDARTSSAFQLVDNEVGYVPSVFKQEYYGADTIVKMEILQNNAVVYTQQKEFTAVKGNALIANSNVPVSFLYIPSDVGNFAVKVVAQVVDDQCQANADSDAQGTFSVLESDPVGRFYTILNQLKVNNTYPKIGDPLLVTYNKITNFADASSNLTPVQTDVDYIVKNGASTVYSRSITMFANPDAVTPVSNSFTFVPATAGVYNITVRARANSALPTNNPEITAEQSMLLTVLGSSSYNVMFNVRSAENGSGISGASVNLYGAPKATDGNGQVTFESVPEGTYTYTITAVNFSSKSDIVKVTSDKFVSVVLHAGVNESEANTAPFMNLPDSMQIRAGTSRTLNYHDYVQDDQDADRSLVLNVTGGNDSIAVSINQNSGVVTFTPQAGFSGTNVISFRLYDTQGATATDSIVVTVSASTSVPVFSSMPDVVTAEDSAAVRVLNLWDYVLDADTPVENLVFSVVSVSNASLASAVIDGGHFLTVYPKQDANGAATINLGVADGVNTANAGILLNVTPVNDAPVVVAIPRIPVINESTNYTLDLSKVFRDVDGDALTYYVTPANNITFGGSNPPNLSISPDFNVNGTRTFNVTAADPFGLNATARFTLYLSFVDDAPFFNMVIPNIQTFEEVQNSLDLTPFENDPEEGPDADGNTLYWRMRLANETNVTPSTSLNTALLTATINSSRDYLLIQPKVNQTGSLNITLFLYDSTGKNASQDITVTVVNVNDAPVFVNLTTQYGEAGVPFVYQLNATDSDPTNDTLSFSIANSTLAGFSMNGAGLINFTPTINGVFNIVLTVTDNFNASTNGTLTLRVNDTTAPAPNGQITPPNPSVYAPNTTYTFGINWTDNGNITGVVLEFNNLNITNVTQSGNTYFANVSNLSAGNYSYRWFARDNASNLNVTNSSNFTVLKANSSMELLLNGTNGNITVAQNSTVPIRANITNTTGSVSILRNNVSVANGAAPLTVNQTFTAAGLYNITASFAGSQNYSASSATWFVNVLDTTPPSFGAMSMSPASPATYTNLYTFDVVVTDNVAVFTVQFELDSSFTSSATQLGNSSTYRINLTSMSVGNHTIKWYASDTSNNLGNSSTYNYTVVQGSPVIGLTINGYASSTSAQVNDTVTIVANVSNPINGFVNLLINGGLVQNGTSPLTNITSFANAGVVNVTASFPGNANVVAGNVTYTLTITPIMAVINILPVNNSVTNYSYLTSLMTLDTTGATTCRWSFGDYPQGSMNNSFTTSNGLNHSANITGLSLGSNNVSVACNNQSAASNTDLVYIAQNILDGSTLIGNNIINNTIMKNSVINASNLSNNVNVSNGNTLRNVTANNSVINSSVLTNCVVNNATVISINATNCNLQNGLFDPSDLTGSNIDGNVRNSNVTYSNVTNSNITNSNINNSVITGSNIMNSSFSNAVVTNANITNNVIYSGTIAVGNSSYTAGAPKNLSDVIPVAPVASFTITGSMTPGSTLMFTSTSTDANPNDNLTYNWTFSGDNVTYNTSNVSKAFAAGTFNATLVVTDTFNLSSSAFRSFTIATPPVYTGGGGGGGGGGGSGGSLARIALTNATVTKVVSVGQPLQFSYNYRPYPLSIVLRAASGNTTEWVMNGIYYTIRKGEHLTFDLSKDGVADLDLAITDVGRNAATIQAKLPGAPAPVAVPPVPMFNFTGAKPPVQPPAVPEVPPVEEPEPETDEKTVPVQAEVKDGVFTRMSNALKGLFHVDAKSNAVKAGIVAGVVIIGLAAYLIFVRWENF